jgi:hypothetical protein
MVTHVVTKLSSTARCYCFVRSWTFVRLQLLGATSGACAATSRRVRDLFGDSGV